MSIDVKLLDCIRTKWKHSNWEVRRNAVITSSIYDIKKLRSLAKNDKHPLVREEAVRKLNDPSFLAELAQHRRSLMLVYLICFILFLIFRVVVFPTDIGGKEQAPINSLSLDYIDRIIAQMQFGNIAFNPPSTLLLGDETVIDLFLSDELTINELKQRLKKVGEKEGYRIRIANNMQASLWGRGFECKAIMPQEQAISPADITHWKWDIKAIRGGKQTLHLTLSTILYINQHATQYAIKTFEREINVQVTWRKQLAFFMKSYWQWIFAVLIIPIVAWSKKVWVRIRLRAKSDASKKPTIILPN